MAYSEKEWLQLHDDLEKIETTLADAHTWSEDVTDMQKITELRPHYELAWPLIKKVHKHVHEMGFDTFKAVGSRHNLFGRLHLYVLDYYWVTQNIDELDRFLINGFAGLTFDDLLVPIGAHTIRIYFERTSAEARNGNVEHAWEIYRALKSLPKTHSMYVPEVKDDVDLKYLFLFENDTDADVDRHLALFKR